MVALVSLPIIKNRFGSKHVEERKNREKMSETDIEIAGDAQVAVERDEAEHGVLSDVCLKGMSEYFPPGSSGLFVCVRDFCDATESIEKSETEYGEEGQRCFHEEDDGEVECGCLVGNRAKEVVRIAAGDAREHHKDTEEILRERFHERNLAHADDG